MMASITDQLDKYRRRLEDKYIHEDMTAKQKANRKIVIDMGIDAMGYGIHDFSQKIEKDVNRHKLILKGIISGIAIVSTALIGIVIQHLLS